MRSASLIAIIPALVLGAGLASQAPSFDVASIRPSPEATGGDIRLTPNGRLMAAGVTVRALILRAYSLHESQLVGAPDWTGSERFEVDARTAATPAGGPDSLLPMMQSLLAARFGLRAHQETRELPAFLLTHARRDRTLGPLIRPTQADCSGAAPALTEAEVRASARDGWPPCGMVYVVSFTTGGPDGVVKVRFRRSAVTMGEFAPTLQNQLGRPVLDRTGLDGRYDLEYSYAPQPNANSPVAEVQNLPSLSVSLEEQLGLRLESQRADVPVLVIDSVSRPTEN
jgi:uncharacterized protein (TIGR03435 family)